MTKRNATLVLTCLLLAGCARSYAVKEYDTEKSDLTAFLATLHPNDEVTLIMTDESQNAGLYYSTQDGYITIQQGRFFRDYPLTAIRAIRYKTESRNVKPMIYALAGVMVAIMIFSFSQQ